MDADAQAEVRRMLHHVRLALDRCKAPERDKLAALLLEAEEWQARVYVLDDLAELEEG